MGLLIHDYIINGDIHTKYCNTLSDQIQGFIPPSDKQPILDKYSANCVK